MARRPRRAGRRRGGLAAVRRPVRRARPRRPHRTARRRRNPAGAAALLGTDVMAGDVVSRPTSASSAGPVRLRGQRRGGDLLGPTGRPRLWDAEAQGPVDTDAAELILALLPGRRPEPGAAPAAPDRSKASRAAVRGDGGRSPGPAARSPRTPSPAMPGAYPDGLRAGWSRCSARPRRSAITWSPNPARVAGAAPPASRAAADEPRRAPGRRDGTAATRRTGPLPRRRCAART